MMETNLFFRPVVKFIRTISLDCSRKIYVRPYTNFFNNEDRKAREWIYGGNTEDSFSGFLTGCQYSLTSVRNDTC